MYSSLSLSLPIKSLVEAALLAFSRKLAFRVRDAFCSLAREPSTAAQLNIDIPISGLISIFIKCGMCRVFAQWVTYTVVLFYNPIGQLLWNKSQYSTVEHDFYKLTTTFYKLTTTIKLLHSNHYLPYSQDMQLQQIMLGGVEGGVCLATCHFVVGTERRFKRKYSESGVIVWAPSKYRLVFVVWEWRR